MTRVWARRPYRHLWLVAATCAILTAGPADNRSGSEGPIQGLVSQYCTSCHNQRLKTGGLTLDQVDLTQIPAHAETWEKVIRKLRSGTMPPAGVRRPDRATYDATASWLEEQIDQAASTRPFAGRPALHRLNRTEYANAVRDLLDLEINANELLPPDDSAFGFDNNADMLGVSPALEERYLTAAGKIARVAVGDPGLSAGSETWRIRQDLSQDQHIDGTPLGTVGGTSVRYTFPLSGRYRFQAKLYRTNLNILRGLETPHQVEISLDGRRIHLAPIGGNEDLAGLFEKPTDTGDAVDARLQVDIPVTAGPHTIAVAFLGNAQFAEPVRLQPFLRSSVDNFDWSGHPHLQTLSVSGPFDSTGPGDTPSRRRIFVCRPSKPNDAEECARRIISALLARAYRQPAAAAGDILRVMAVYRSASQEKSLGAGGFETGIQAAVERILASPKFIFRSELDPAGLAPGSTYRLGGVDLASRLSFFLWSSIPDEPLLRLAAQDRLKDPKVLEAEARRMLADPRADAIVNNFAGQWLQLRNLANVQPNTDEFPNFDDNLRQAFRQETELLFRSVLSEGRSALDLLTADFTFVNERLAQHYGIPDVYGARFRRVAIVDEARKGLLGQGSILALTSHAERTSPVVRGKWILENLMGLSVPPPPPDVPPLKPVQDGEQKRTMREQMAEHRASPVCATCHKTLDPIGFALENFDAVGAWRSQEAGKPIDASGELGDGTKVDGVVALRQAILSRQEVFVQTVTEKLLTYALGRGLDYRDMPAVRAIVRESQRNNYRLNSLILGVVESTPFRMNSVATAQ
jgi:hypothetical protein